MKKFTKTLTIFLSLFIVATFVACEEEPVTSPLPFVKKGSTIGTKPKRTVADSTKTKSGIFASDSIVPIYKKIEVDL